MTRRTKAELLGELFEAVRANQLATDKMDDAAARGMGVNRTDARCLDIIERLGPVTAGRLATDAGLTSGTVTAVVDRLVEKGYVQRVADPGDRRRVLIAKTEKLEEASEHFYGPLAAAAGPLVGKFTVAETEAVIRFLTLATEVIERRVAELIDERS